MSTGAYFILAYTQSNPNVIAPINVSRARYSRVLNDVGRVELDAILPQIDLWGAFIGHAAIAMYFGGRCEDIWVVKDYERSAISGRVSVYGENLAYLLRDALRKAKMGVTGLASNASKISGDVGEMMYRASTIPLTEPAAFEIDYALWRPSNYKAGFQGSVDYQWGSPASLMAFLSDLSVSSFRSRYRSSWYVRGHTMENGRVSASLIFVHPNYAYIPLWLTDVRTVRVEHSQAATIVSGVGQGVGAERDARSFVSPLLSAARNRALARVEKTISSFGSDSDSVAREAQRKFSSSIGGDIKLRPNTPYFNFFELGSFLTVSASGGFFPSNTAIAGWVMQIEGEYNWGVVKHTIRLAG